MSEFVLCYFIDIIKQQRLTVVVNKMDSAMLPKFGRSPISRSKLVGRVRQYLCENIFECSDNDLPEDLIIPVCGNWAFYGRSFQINPTDECLTNEIHEEFNKCLKCMPVDYEKRRECEKDTDSKADILISESRIEDLGTR